MQISMYTPLLDLEMSSPNHIYLFLMHLLKPQRVKGAMLRSFNSLNNNHILLLPSYVL